MNITYEYRLQNVIAQLRTTANQFSNAASSVQSRAEHLAGISLDITYSASDWSGLASTAFQNAWMQYDLDTQKAIATLNETSNAMNNLARRIEQIVDEKRNAEMREEALLVATFGLTLVDMLQLGLDPATDALTATTAAGAAARVAEAINIEALLEEADIVAEGELSGIFSPVVNLLNELRNSEFAGTSIGDIDMTPVEESITDVFYLPVSGAVISDISAQLEENVTSEDHSPSLYVGISKSLFNRNPKLLSGSILGTPVNETGSIDIAKFSGGMGIQDHSGKTFAGVEAEATLLDAEIDQRIGTERLGVTSGNEIKAFDADLFAGYHKGTFGVDASIDYISDTFSTGVNVAGMNVGVDATIGLKAEIGFNIGEKTELKLPFISFGFNFGGAK